MAEAAFLACDWGTTNLRAWAVTEAGEVVREAEFECGVGRLAQGEAERVFRERVRSELGGERLPAILCGMIGSDLGWRTVPYLDCPARLDDLAAGLVRVADDPPAWVVPGLRGPGITGSAPDVMRGEETQILGWTDGRGGQHVICHPGTHAKWALVRDGRLERFVTAMTGELFGLITRHGVLRTDVQAGLDDAFLAGVDAAGDGGALASRLFSARARVVGGGAPAEETASYVSGLLIGAEIASAPGCLDASPGPLTLIGEPELCRLYAAALSHRGQACEVHDGRGAALAGLTAIYREGIGR